MVARGLPGARRRDLGLPAYVKSRGYEQADLLVAVSLLDAASVRSRQARTLGEARAALAAERPAAVVLDIRFDEGDAWAFLKEIKSSPETAEIPVLVMTATDDEDRALALGAQAFVRKPVDRRNLVRSLLRLLNRKPALDVLHVDDDQGSIRTLHRSRP